MFIFLDTNIYFDHWFLTSPQFTLLASYCRRTSATLLVPQVVVEEIEAKFASKWGDFVELLSELPRRFDEVGVDKALLPPIPPQPKYDFALIVRRTFRHVRFLPYEEVPHGPLVARAIHARRPFRDKEKGYRDALMWESLLAFLSSAKSVSPVAFINANTKDFYDPAVGSSSLHPDLIADLALKQIENPFLLYTAVRFFNEAHVETSIPGLDKDEFADKYLAEIENLAEEAAMSYLEQLPVSSLRSLLINAGYASIAALAFKSTDWTLWEGLEDYSFHAFTKVSKDKLYINFHFDMKGLGLQISMFTLDYLANQAELDSDFINQEINGAETSMDAYLRCDFKAGIIFNIVNEEVEQISIDNASFHYKR